jgi:diguanylate cyclase (GGDEF)-like protein
MTKILIIEDDKTVMASARDLLEAEGYDVATAENGRRGVEMARQVRPDLIICDVMMPEVDGHHVLMAIRDLSETNAIPFIFLTAKADKSDIRQGMKLGADDYLTKPYTRMDLLDAITSRLAKQKTLNQHFNSQLRQVEDRLHYALYYDSLTGLPNRLLFREQFQKALPAQPPADWVVAVVYLSLDRYNQISDNLGPDYTNLLLKAVTGRLKATLGEQASISRLQADEFALILSGSSTTLSLAQTCQAILVNLAKPYNFDQLEVYATASLGIGFYPDDGSELEGLLDNARVSMLQARKQGGDKYEFYQPSYSTRSLDLVKLETGLRHALERNELEVYYQPQVSIQTGGIVGAEALLRWKHPERGYISPAIFIPLIEETALIHEIGEWVLKTACSKVKSWQEAGLPPIHIAVNVSSRQIYHPNFLSNVSRIVQETGLPLRNLELELTESALLHEVVAANAVLRRLRAVGIQIAIDDFGTGYSSLSYLKQFPFDTLKIDRLFIQNIGQDPESSAITLATIQMAHSLNLKVIAEGVETKSELDFLRKHDCDEIQGYYFSYPLPEGEFEKLLASSRRLENSGPTVKSL